MNAEIVNALISLFGLLTVTFGGAAYNFRIRNKELKLKNLHLQEEIQDKSLSLQMDLQMFNQIKEVVEEILLKTKADRFVILTATNGKFELRFATAIYEHHKKCDKVTLSIGATNKYIKFEFDSEYRKMLKEVELYGYMNLETSKMRNSDLKSIYESEEINFSNLYFLQRSAIDANNDRMFYCSAATHENNNFLQKENIIIKSSIDKLKSKFKEL